MARDIEFDSIRLRGLKDVILKTFGAAQTDRYILKDFDGFGPPDVDLSFGKKGSRDVFLTKSASNREITLDIGLNPDYTMGERPRSLRTELYGLLTPSLSVSQLDDSMKVELLLGGVLQVSVRGWVKRIEPKIMTKDPQVQVVIRCDGPYWEAPEVTLTPSLNGGNSFVVTNEGSAPSGISLKVRLTANTSTFTVSNPFTGKFIAVENRALFTDDYLTFNTTEGSRSIILERGITENISGYLKAGSIWPQLVGGNNNFTFNPTGLTVTSLKYTPKFWGV